MNEFEKRKRYRKSGKVSSASAYQTQSRSICQRHRCHFSVTQLNVCRIMKHNNLSVLTLLIMLFEELYVNRINQHSSVAQLLSYKSLSRICYSKYEFLVSMYTNPFAHMLPVNINTTYTTQPINIKSVSTKKRMDTQVVTMHYVY